MGLFDRFKGKKQHDEAADPAAEATEQPQTESPVESSPDSSSAEAATTEQDMTEQWLAGARPASPKAAPEMGAYTGVAGTIKPLTHSAPVDTGDPSKSKPEPAPAPPPLREVTPVSEAEIDRLHAQAMKGHSSKDIEALWDAVLSKKELFILNRGKGLQSEAHAIESPLGPMLLLFTDRFRVRAFTSSKAFQKMPYVWRAATLPTEDALEWIFQQHAKGVQAVEFNRSEQPGFASVLQAIPARYERLHGRRPKGADLVDPDFEALANRARISGDPREHEQVIKALFSLQRWYALRDPQRPNQPGFTPVEDKPTLMLFTSEEEARAAAVQSGRERELPKVIMPLMPSKVVPWMSKLPDMGADQAIINLASTAFLLPLHGVERHMAPDKTD